MEQDRGELLCFYESYKWILIWSICSSESLHSYTNMYYNKSDVFINKHLLRYAFCTVIIHIAIQ